MRIGPQITLGFTIVMALAIALGALAVSSMSSASTKAEALTLKQIPAVTVSVEVERESLLTMFAVRGYTMSGNVDMLKDGESLLLRVQEGIARARKLAKEQDLPVLGEAAKEAESKAQDYSEALKKAKSVKIEIDLLAQERNAAAASFTKSSEAYLKGQVKMMS